MAKTIRIPKPMDASMETEELEQTQQAGQKKPTTPAETEYETRRKESTANRADISTRNKEAQFGYYDPKVDSASKVASRPDLSPEKGKYDATGAGRLYTDAVRWSLDEKERIHAKYRDTTDVTMPTYTKWANESVARKSRDKALADVDKFVEEKFQEMKRLSGSKDKMGYKVVSKKIRHSNKK